MSCFLTSHPTREADARGKTHHNFWPLWPLWPEWLVKLTINLIFQTVLFSWNPTFTGLTWCGENVNIVRSQVAGQNF